VASISGVAAAYVELTQARVQAELAARLAKIARVTGAPQQVLELVRQATDTASESLSAAIPDASQALGIDAQRLDLTA
jgi:hypothetical protein